MAMYDEMPPAVLQRTAWKPSAMLVFAMLILTVLTVQLGGKIRSQRKIALPEPTTVVVGQYPQTISPKQVASTASNLANQTPRSSKTVQSIKDQVTSPELIRQALNDLERSGERNSILANATTDTVKSIQQELQVEIAESPLGEKCLQMHLPWQNTQLAAKFLKILGTRYADQYRTAWMNDNAQECLAIKSAIARTGQAYEEAVAQLEFWRQYLDWQTILDEAELTPTTTVPTQKASSPLSALHSPLPAEKAASPLRADSDVENPEWTDLQNNLVETRKKEAKLLVTRTTMHPEVKFVQDQIREYEAQIAKTPRWVHKETSPLPTNLRSVPGEGPGVRAEEPVVSNNSANRNTTPKNPSPTPNNFSAAQENEQLLVQLENEVERTAAAYRKALAREQTMLGQQNIGPEISVRAWEPRKIAVVAQKPSSGSFGWLAGLAMAVGVGLICTGAAIESPIGSVQELHRLTAVPIVGVVPSYNPAVDPRVVKRTKTLLRFGLFLSGMMLMVGCVWGIVRLM